MAEYLVTWICDTEANTPTQAAKDMLDLIREPGSTASVFNVTNTKTKVTFEVDLHEKTVIRLPKENVTD